MDKKLFYTRLWHNIDSKQNKWKKQFHVSAQFKQITNNI